MIDVRGQRVSARDRLYLLNSMPTLIVWGERDNTIPLAHGRDTHEAVPGSRFETLPRAAHFPNLEDPEGLAAVLRDFIETTEPARHRRLGLGRAGRPALAQPDAAGDRAPRRLALRSRGGDDPRRRRGGDAVRSVIEFGQSLADLRLELGADLVGLAAH